MDEVRFINANALCQHIQDWKTRCQELHRHSVGKVDYCAAHGRWC